MRKKSFLVSLVLAVNCPMLYAQGQECDSLLLQEVEILSVRATKTTPVAYCEVGKEELSKANTGVDLPYLLAMTPSAVATSDAGSGIGYTTLRVRGTDATRINFTVNNIPINDAESHNVFWVNMPDFASSVKDVQLQRGVGTSTNGAGAFGASINMQTGRSVINHYAKADFSFGSFMTHKESVAAGTGLIADHWAVDLRLSNIGSNGYIDRASANLQSYYLQGGYYGNNSTLRFITFSGREETYHAWNYASKEEMQEYGRTYNSCGYMFTDANGVSHYYSGQTDNYVQQNYQLLFDHWFNDAWSMNVGLHYTKGDGYYREYKKDRSFVEYALQPFDFGDTVIESGDLVRKKAMDNHFGGAVFSLNYRSRIINTTLGGGVNRYLGKHFGQVLWVKDYIGDYFPEHEYYRNNAVKNDANIYLKADYAVARGLNIYADVQYRHIGYTINGNNDKWNYNTGALQSLSVDENFDFLNPKAGVSWLVNDANRLFASASMAHKEPTRNNYTDGKLYEMPKAERLIDYELGYTFSKGILNAGVNLYFMDYKNQLVLTGELNEIGEPLTANIPDSYRAGVELMAGVDLKCGFSWKANATFSHNRIKDFTEVLYDDNTFEKWEIYHKDTPIAFSPAVIANNSFSYVWRGVEASLQSQFVSKQYMSNSGVEEHLLDAYFVTNLRLSYSFRLKGIKNMRIGVTVYNLFNEEYENNGYAGSGYYTDSNGERVRYHYAGYAAQAGINAIGNFTIEL
ncbi:MAG: TonB-dependent receptor [Bacteroidaceae bacterium]|nr:TonB-dependent receptor [Bacteroidaceae bacterium]